MRRGLTTWESADGRIRVLAGCSLTLVRVGDHTLLLVGDEARTLAGLLDAATGGVPSQPPDEAAGGG